MLALFAMWVLHAGYASAQTTPPDASSTPRRLVAAFFQAAGAGDWKAASALLGPPSASHAKDADHGVERARELDYLLERRAWIRLDAVSDDPNGTPEDGELVERVATLRVDGGDFTILLERTRTTPPRWSFSADTLARVPSVYAERGPSLLETLIPSSLRVTTLGLQTWQWIGVPLALLLAIVGSRLVSFVMRAGGRAAARRTKTRWDDELVEAAHGPVRLFIACFAYGMLSYSLGLPAGLRLVTFHVLLTSTIVALVWMALRGVEVISNHMERGALRAQASVAKGETATEAIRIADIQLRARGVRTRIQMLRRVASVALIIVGGSLVLTQFEAVRSVGVSLLASAGVAGVVVGLAAQRTIGSLIAGIQLSVTQPVRIGDTVEIEKESGVIEEITLTYAILKCWDERRLVIPITRFLEHPFQNLTRVATGQLGGVVLYASWTLPVDALRKEVDRLLADCTLWDGRTKTVHVTEAKEQSIEVRVLVSTANPDDLFDLRAWLRERLVGWLQALDGGIHLPRVRLESRPSKQ